MKKEYGYEYDAVLFDSIWKETEGKTTIGPFWGAYCLRSGRDALKAIAREFSPRVAFLPAMACDSMVFPFEMYGHSVRYYRLNPDYSIDTDSIGISDEKSIFLYMNYFGNHAISDLELECLKSKGNIVFVEDRTHDLIWERTSLFQPDYTIASLRKWLPIPDGGLLWGEINKPLASDTSFSYIRLKAQCMRHRFLENGDEKIKTEYRKIFSEVPEIIRADEPGAMSVYSYTLAKKTDWDEVRNIRKENAETLNSILQSSRFVTLIQEQSQVSDLYVAFSVQNRDIVQKRLSKKGIFNTIIWPLRDEQRKICEVSRLTEKSMLAAPCDQRYTAEDMKYIGKEMIRTIADVNG